MAQVPASRSGGRVPLLARRLWFRVSSPARLVDSGRKALRLVRRDGVAGLWRRAFELNVVEREFGPWIEAYDVLAPADRAAIQAHIHSWPDPPLLSVVMPVYNTPERELRRAIASVREQLYPRWELCIAEDASSAPHVRHVVAEAAAQDARISAVFRSSNGGIAAASNSALALATGSHVALLDSDDELSLHALYLVAAALVEQPGLDFLYSDEDKLDEAGNRCLPYFKPDWNPDLLLNQHYAVHLAVYRKALLDGIGGFRSAFDGSQDFDLVLRATEHLEAGCVRHLPFVLYHWRMIAGSGASDTGNKGNALPAARRAMDDALTRRRLAATVQPGLVPDFFRVAYALPEPAPLVSVIVAHSAAGGDEGAVRLRRCVESVLERTAYPRFEVRVLDGGTADPAVLACFDAWRRDERVRVQATPAGATLPATLNLGAQEARGDVLCWLSDAAEVHSPGWLTELVSQALRPGIGAAGARLLTPGGALLHAGMATGLLGGAGHPYRGVPAQFPVMGQRTFVVQDVSAVSGACLAVRQAHFAAAGGWDDRYAAACADVDLCLRLGERGLRTVWTPFASLTLHGTLSAPGASSPDVAALIRRWGERLTADPAYSPNLTLEREDGGLAFPPRVAMPWRSRS